MIFARLSRHFEFQKIATPAAPSQQSRSPISMIISRKRAPILNIAREYRIRGASNRECSSKYIRTVWTKQRVGTRTINCFSVTKKIVALNQRRLDSLLGESGRMSRPIKLRHFPHACKKLVPTKIFIPLINIDFFRILMQFFLEISLYATFRTVNHPLERFLER